jgi:energy-converting hydrogenase Eha subunit B
VLSIIAVGVLGALLVFVGIEMCRHSFKTDSLAITCLIGILALASSMTLAFIIGMIAVYFVGYIRKKPKSPSDTTG